MTVKRILGGDYGDGTLGLKCSLPGFDVSVLSDDFDATRRSFNSEWTSLCKIKMIGAATQVYTQYQSTFVNGPFISFGTAYWFTGSTSGWELRDIKVPTGLPYMPIWEERIYDPSSKIFYDDKIFAGYSASSESSFSGSRSYFSGPGAQDSNALYLRPWFVGNTINDPSTPITVSNQNSSGQSTSSVPPAYPAYPAKPTNPVPSCAYIIYANKLGDVS